MFKYKDVFNLELSEKFEKTGRFDFPVIKSAKTIPKSIIPFNKALSTKNANNSFVHFYIDDYQFERLWNRPYYYVKALSKYPGIIGPDYSTYTNMPKAQQIFQVYKSRLISAYFQSQGYTVIPNISWSDEESLEWTLEGIPQHSVVALSTNGVLNKKTKQTFINCYKKAMEMIHPSEIIIVGEVPKEIQSPNIVQFDNHIKQLRCLQKKE